MSKRSLLNEPDPPPPILGTWKRVYAVILVNTVLTYALLVLFAVSTR